jgi:DNA-binding CsgD family transcriptional regulator
MIVAPTSLCDDAYRREFYDSVNIFEEVALCSEIGGRRLYVAYYRERAKGHFRRSEIELLAACGQSVFSVLNKQADMARRLGCLNVRPQPLSRDELLKKVNAAILEDAPQLTQREAEICAGIILGYTVVGLSLNLGISVNTVATHRKRAYAKLRISSQNELFVHYFGLVERLNQ